MDKIIYASSAHIYLRTMGNTYHENDDCFIVEYDNHNVTYYKDKDSDGNECIDLSSGVES